MIKLLICCTIAVVTWQSGFGQAFSWIHVLSGGTGNNMDEILDIDSDQLGNVYVLGSFHSTLNVGGLSFTSGYTNSGGATGNRILMKFDAAGNVQWGSLFYSTDLSTDGQVEVDPLGNIYTATRFNDQVQINGGPPIGVFGSNDPFVLVTKFDPFGNVQATHTGRVSGSYYGIYGLESDVSGNVYLHANAVSSFSFLGWQMAGGFVTKISPTGNAVWHQPVYNQGIYGPVTMEIDPKNNVYVTGQFTNSMIIAGVTTAGPSFLSTYLAKLGSAGNHLWTKVIPGSGSGRTLLFDLEFTPDGYIYGAGYTTGMGAYDFLSQSTTTGAILMEMDSNGTGLWRSIVTSQYGGWKDIDRLPSGEMYIGGSVKGPVNLGSTQVQSGTVENYVVGKIDSLGNWLWANAEPAGTAGGNINGVEPSGTGYVIAAGRIGTPVTLGGYNFPNGWVDMILAKVSDNANYASGNLFYDTNGNGTQEPNEQGMPSRVMTVDGNRYYSTNLLGNYHAVLDAGTYTVVPPAPPLYHSVVPASRTFSFPGSNLTNNGLHFGFAPIPGIQDLVACGSALGIYRPGLPVNYTVNCSNIGTVALTAVVQMTHDTAVTLSAIFPPPNNVSGNTLTWNLPTLSAFSSFSISMVMEVDTFATIYQPIVHLISSTPVAQDSTPGNNSCTNYDIVRNSFDPNDKVVMPDRPIHPVEVAAQTPLSYRIRFQNTGNAPAHTVRLEDTLSSTLDPASFEMVSASHNYEFLMTPGGVAQWYFNGIELPDSSADFLGSQGYVEYRIRPRTSLQLGDTIPNGAAIYFDFNPPIYTNIVKTPVALSELQTTVLQHVACAGDSNGLVTAQGSGLAPFTYGQDSMALSGIDSFGGLPAGMYIFYMMDGIGDIVADTVWVTEPPVLGSTLQSSPSTGPNDGTITATGSGGTPPYTYSIDGINFQSSGLFSGLAAGNYPVTVRDANGCDYLQTINVGLAIGISSSSLAGIKVYPVPNHGVLHLSSEIQDALTGKWQLIDAHGKSVKEWSIETGHQADVMLDLSQLPAGIYFLEGQRPNGNFRTVISLMAGR